MKAVQRAGRDSLLRHSAAATPTPVLATQPQSASPAARETLQKALAELVSCRDALSAARRTFDRTVATSSFGLGK